MSVIILRETPPQARLLLRHPPVLLRQSGVGGWAERQHDRAKASTEWVGTPLHTMTLRLFFDSIRSSRAADVEGELGLLHQFGLPTSTTGEPPVLRLMFGHGQQLRWVIQSIQHNSVVNQPGPGRRVQAEVDVDLLEHRQAVLSFSPVESVEDAAGQGPDAGSTTEADGGAGSGRTYTVRAGDTLSAIAARELGSASRFPEIFRLNTPDPLSSPDLIIPGQILKLPEG